MISTNVELNNIQLLGLNAAQTAVAESSSKQDVSAQEDNSDAAKVDLSDSVKGEFNQVLTKEDLIVKKINSAQTIYDNLKEIRLELAGLMKTLRDKDTTDTVDKIKELDEKSNTLIDKTINVIKKNDTYGLVNTNYLSKMFESLGSLKKLNLDEINYLDKLSFIVEKVGVNQTNYSTATENLYNEFANNSSSLVPNNTQIIDSKTMQGIIINNYNEALVSSMSKLTPDVVQRLLENK
ncbi:hypothetical protein IJD34_01745 [bacterium]|nr:hypothetical protein [bacterium]